MPFPLTLIRRDWALFFVGFRSWRKRARWAWHKLNAAPSAIRIVVIAATVLAVFSATNLVYQVVRKPTVYGRDGVMGTLEPQRGIGVGGHEAFILWDVISESQDLSRTIATNLSHLAVHNPVPKWHGLISGVAFPYSPPEIDRGPVYEFHLNHVLVPDSPTALFRTDYQEV